MVKVSRDGCTEQSGHTPLMYAWRRKACNRGDCMSIAWGRGKTVGLVTSICWPVLPSGWQLGGSASIVGECQLPEHLR